MNLTAKLAALNLNTRQGKGVEAAVFPLQAEAEPLRAQAKLGALKIQALTFELAHLKRSRFGVKNAALSSEQRDLFRETLAVDSAAIAAETAQHVPAARAPRARAGRQPLPEHLPRIVHHHAPESCTCGQCGGALVKIGEDLSEQLDVELAKFFVHRHIRAQYACRPCERVVAAAIPAAVIDGGMAAGLIAWVLISKYVDRLPLYRLEQIAARAGVTVARSTLAEWVGRYGVALQPLADRLSAQLRLRSLLHADETPVQQLDPGPGKTKRAYRWAYRSGELDEGPPIAVVDDYAGYQALFGAGVTEVGCMAHARCRFFELQLANQSPIAGEALQRISELYEIESRGRNLANGERQSLREREAWPKLQAMRDWLQRTRATVANGGSLARAMDYSLKRWPALSRYARSAILPIDNNPVENIIRPITLGKKNWLFTAL